MNLKEIYLPMDHPAKILFWGSSTAELFTKEIQESFEGVIKNNIYYDDENVGFVSASIGGRPWDGTMWTRDAGVFIRELVHWGYLGTACLCANRLIELCSKNQQGYFAFPERFDLGIKGYGQEIDGTAAILIGFALLMQRLIHINELAANLMREKIQAFICQKGSPLRFVLDHSKKTGLVAGTGEFGGGMFVEGEYCNIVQNMLAANALKIWSDLLMAMNQPQLSVLCSDAQEVMEGSIQRHLIDASGFNWCVDPEALTPPNDVISAEANVGFSGINGAGAMASDVRTPDELNCWWGMTPAFKTFNKLCESPARKSQYDKYGLYLQFERYCQGLLTSPSYGQGYAIQLALIAGEKKVAGKMLEYLAKQTCCPPKGYILHRESEKWFYERMLSPDYFDLPIERQTVEEGCGALNLVNVAEPLKIARLLAGVGTIVNNGEFHPYIANGFTMANIIDWTVITPNGLQCKSYDIDLQ